MLLLDETNAISYFSSHGIEALRVIPLGGGVSNVVLLVETGSKRLVVKQALERLKVKEEWLSDPRRTLRECASIRQLAAHLPAGAVPSILFEDQENCIYGMTAAAADAEDWKTQLLRGEIRPAVAANIGATLGAIMQTTSSGSAWQEQFGDQTVFDQLRLDPYYRFTATRHPDLKPQFDAIIASASTRRYCLVHGDYSPKNFLVAGNAAMAIDFEVVHFGDPSFDAAFLLNHLRLKSFFRPQWAVEYAVAAAAFWQALQPAVAELDWFEPATIAHLGGLMLARIDGKSPAEYIAEDALRQQVRQYARNLMLHPPKSVLEVFA